MQRFRQLSSSAAEKFVTVHTNKENKSVSRFARCVTRRHRTQFRLPYRATANSNCPAGPRCKVFSRWDIYRSLSQLFFFSQVRCAYRLVGEPPRPKFTKMGEDMLRTNTRDHAKFHRCWPKVYDKSVTKVLLRQNKLNIPTTLPYDWINSLNENGLAHSEGPCSWWRQSWG